MIYTVYLVFNKNVNDIFKNIKIQKNKGVNLAKSDEGEVPQEKTVEI